MSAAAAATAVTAATSGVRSSPFAAPHRSQFFRPRPSTSGGVNRARASSIAETNTYALRENSRLTRGGGPGGVRSPARVASFASAASKRSISRHDIGGPGDSLLDSAEITGNSLLKVLLALIAPQFESKKDLGDQWTTYLRRVNYVLIWIGFGLTLVPDLDPLVQHIFIGVITVESAVRLGIKKRLDLLYVIDVCPPIIYFMFWAFIPGRLDDAFQAIVLRAIRFLKYSILYPSIKKGLSSCNSLAVVIVISFFFLGTLAYLTERGDYDPDSERFFSDGDPSPIDSILVSLYWAFVTASTIGYGDIVPSTWPGRIIAVITVYSGIVMIAVPGILVGRHFVHLYKKEHEEKVKAITEHICRQTDQIVRNKNAPELLNHIRALNDAIEQHKLALQMVEEAVQIQREKDRVDKGAFRVKPRPADAPRHKGTSKVRTW